MKLLLKNVLIADKYSPFFGKTQDILLEDGLIINIQESIHELVDETISIEGLTVSQGWVDIFTDFADPGFEYRESIESGAEAAIAGGFTHVFVVPNTKPSLQNKPQISYITEKSKGLAINVYPIGAISKNLEGKDLAEMYEMQQAGAIAFSDGLHPVQSAGLLLKAFQYIQAFEGAIIQLPIDKSIGSFGLITEGVISTQLGLPGIPALSETLIVKRDLDLLRYTESKLHITGITTAQSVQLIKEAKKEGISISCSVTPYHLFYCDEDMVSYDTNLKVNPPLRIRADRLALRNAVEEGIIDCITSHHLPQNWDNKTCEFEYAAYGMIGLQSSFYIINQLFDGLSVQVLVDLLCNNARVLFNLPINKIDIGCEADLTLFTRVGDTILSSGNNKSKSANSAFFNVSLPGKIVGVYTKGKWHKN